jgi:hypothetical protein
MHGNRHTFAQMTFNEALEKYSKKDAKEKNLRGFRASSYRNYKDLFK